MDLDDFQRRATEWANRTFPQANGLSKCEHLRREVEELRDAMTRGDRTFLAVRREVANEAADCLLLLLHICDEFSIDLSTAAEAKFAVVRQRTWGAPDEHGVVEHVRAVGDERRADGSAT